MNAKTREQLLLVPEVAARLRVHPQTVYTLARRGDIKASRVGRGARAPLRFRPEDVDAYLDEHPAA